MSNWPPSILAQICTFPLRIILTMEKNLHQKDSNFTTRLEAFLSRIALARNQSRKALRGSLLAQPLTNDLSPFLSGIKTSYGTRCRRDN